MSATHPPMLLSSHSLDASPSSPRALEERGQDQARSIRRIVACVDGSVMGRAVACHAQAVGRAFGGQITLLHVLETAGSGEPAAPLDWGLREREARAHLDELVAQLEESEIPVQAELIQGRAAEQICNWAERHRADLTVFCTHGERGETEWDLASTARKILDRAPGSVLVVPATRSDKGAVRYRRILVPLDGSPRSESVIPIAIRIAGADGADVTLAHIIAVPEITRTGPFDTEGAELERLVVEHNERVAREYMDRLRARVRHENIRVHTRIVRDGSVRTRLDRLIREEGSDLVVMAAHGHSGRSDCACGSVAEYTATHATAPLLILRERIRLSGRRAALGRGRSLERPSASRRTAG